jgi:hypothetical protein
VTIWWFPEPLSHNTIGSSQVELVTRRIRFGPYSSWIELQLKRGWEDWSS